MPSRLRDRIDVGRRWPTAIRVQPDVCQRTGRTRLVVEEEHTEEDEVPTDESGEGQEYEGEGRAKLSTMTKVTRSGGRTRAGAGREGRGSNILGSRFGKDFICPLFERYEEQ